MQVKATRRGFYGRSIEPGEVFDIAHESMLGSWMDPVDPKDRARLAKRIEALGRLRKRPPMVDLPLTTASSPKPLQPTPPKDAPPEK